MSSYPDETKTFLKSQKDQFANPVGHTLRKEIENLFEALLSGRVTDEAKQFLDRVIRIRAIQDFTPAHAVGFVFDLKSVIRDQMGSAVEGGESSRELYDMDRRIDALGLMAFDVYAACRHQVYEIRCRELRSSHHLLLKRAGMIYEGEEEDENLQP